MDRRKFKGLLFSIVIYASIIIIRYISFLCVCFLSINFRCSTWRSHVGYGSSPSDGPRQHCPVDLCSYRYRMPMMAFFAFGSDHLTMTARSASYYTYWLCAALILLTCSITVTAVWWDRNETASGKTSVDSLSSSELSIRVVSSCRFLFIITPLTPSIYLFRLS